MNINLYRVLRIEYRVKKIRIQIQNFFQYIGLCIYFRTYTLPAPRYTL